MASWMRWAFGLLAMCVVAGMLIVRQTPATMARAADRLHVTQQSEIRTIRDGVRSASRALLQHAARDSVLHFLPDTPGVRLELRADMPAVYRRRDAWGNELTVEPQLTDSSVARIEAAIARELREIGGSKARIAMVALPGFIERVAIPSVAMPVQYFAGVDSAGAWCAIVIGVYTGDEREAVQHVLEGNNPLGPCRLWARHGAPGGAIGALLPDAGHLMAGKEPSRPDPPDARRGLFGMHRDLGPDLGTDLRAQGCLAGRDDACFPALLDETQWASGFFLARAGDGPALLARSAMSHAPSVVEHLFADIEREIGAEAFERLWRADGDAQAALDQALDERSSRWLGEWARARYGVDPRGPVVDFATLALTLLALAALLALATALARARRIA